MRNIILAGAVMFALSNTAQANVIIDEYVKTKLDLEQSIQEGRDQLSRNKEELKGYFFKIKGFVIDAKEKLESLNNGQ